MSGINFLRRLLMKEAVKKSASSSGIMSINKNIIKEVERDIVKYIKSAEKQGVNLDDFSEEKIKYIIQLNKPKPIKAISADSPEGEVITRDLFNMIDRRSGKNVIKTDFGGGITKTTKSIDLSKYDDAALNALAEEGNKIKVQLEKLGESGTNYGEFKKLSARKKEIDDILSAAQDVPVSGYDNFKADLSLQKQTTKVDVVTDTVTNMKKMTPIEAMKEANLVIARKGKYKNLTIDESQDILKKTNDHIFERDIKYDEFGEIIKPDPEDLAGGGIAGMLGERTGFKRGTKPEKKEAPEQWGMQDMSIMRLNYPYRDVTEKQFAKQNPEVYTQLKKDPVFNWKEFQKVGWSNPEDTRIAIKKEGKRKEPGWGYKTRSGNIGVNYLPFGKKEDIGGIIDLKSPSDTDKVSTILHELRHKKFDDMKLWKSKAVPEWVRKVHGNYDYAPSGGYIGGTEGQQVGLRGKPHWERTAYDLTEEELYNRFLDQRFLPSRSKEHMAGSKFKPYFDKILRDKWEPHAKAYREYLETENLPNPRGMRKYKYLAGGGSTGSGLNYLMGEDDQNMRVPFGLGGIDKARRAFLKIIGGTAAGVGVAKSGLFSLLKSGKPVSKVLTQVPIKDIAGMPPWFKPLVNQIIKKGDDVTKTHAYKDMQVVHKTHLPESKTEVILTQNIDTGDVVVDIGAGKHGFAAGHHGQPVRLEYKAAEDIMTGPDMDDMHKVGVRDPHIKVKRRDEMTFDQKKHPDKTPEEFWVEEAEFTGGHPENVKFEDVTYEKFGEHGSDFTEVEKFATGKVKKVKPTKKKLKTEYESGKAESMADDIDDIDDMASGGRVPLDEGGPIQEFETLEEEFERDFKIYKEGGGKGDKSYYFRMWSRGGIAQGGRVPMWMGGGLGKGKTLLKEMIEYFSKGSKHGKKPSEYLKISNPKQYKKMLEDLSMYKKYHPGEGIMAPEMIREMIKKTEVDRAGVIEHILSAARNIKKSDKSIAVYKKQMVDAMVEKGADKESAEFLADGMSKAIDTKVTPKITDEGLLEMEQMLKNLKTKGRKLNATGGRVSLSAGGLAGMLGE